jgi:hypothetical protein
MQSTLSIVRNLGAVTSGDVVRVLPVAQLIQHSGCILPINAFSLQERLQQGIGCTIDVDAGSLVVNLYHNRHTIKLPLSRLASYRRVAADLLVREVADGVHDAGIGRCLRASNIKRSVSQYCLSACRIRRRGCERRQKEDNPKNAYESYATLTVSGPQVRRIPS